MDIFQYTNVITGIVKILVKKGIHLTRQDLDHIIKIFKKLDPIMLKNYSPEQINNTIIPILEKRFAKTTPEPEIKSAPKAKPINKPVKHTTELDSFPAPIDMKVVLNNEMNQQRRPKSRMHIKHGQTVHKTVISNLMGIKDIPTLQLLLNPSSLYERHYLALDSNYRLNEDSTTNSFKTYSASFAETTRNNITETRSFKFLYFYGKNTGTGCLSQREIKNIVAMKLYQPLVPNTRYVSTATFANGMVYENAKRIGLLVKEFKAQSFFGPQNYHFLFYPQLAVGRTEADGDRHQLIHLLNSDSDNGEYKFHRPIQNFDSITIELYSDDNLITFPAEYFARFVLSFEFICLRDTADEME